MAYSSVFLPALLNVLPATDQPLLIVVGHVNPNRVALLQELARIYAGLELIASNPGAKLLEELWVQKGEHDHLLQCINVLLQSAHRLKCDPHVHLHWLHICKT